MKKMSFVLFSFTYQPMVAPAPSILHQSWKHNTIPSPICFHYANNTFITVPIKTLNPLFRADTADIYSTVPADIYSGVEGL